jgi:hypothetical protein
MIRFGLAATTTEDDMMKTMVAMVATLVVASTASSGEIASWQASAEACRNVSILRGVGIQCRDGGYYALIWQVLGDRYEVRAQVTQEVPGGPVDIWATDCWPAIGRPGWECR